MHEILGCTILSCTTFFIPPKTCILRPYCIPILPFLSKNNILSLFNFAEKETSVMSFANYWGFSDKNWIKFELTLCSLVFGCWELSHVIFLKLRKKELLAKCIFTKDDNLGPLWVKIVAILWSCQNEKTHVTQLPTAKN